MVEVKVTETIRAAFGLVLEKKKGLSVDELKTIHTHNSESTTAVPYSLIQTTSKSLQLLLAAKELPPGTPVWAHELIKGSNVIVPSIAEKSPETHETVEKRKKLEAYVSNIRYRKMVKNITTSREVEQLQEKAEMADFKSQIGIGITLVIGWWVGKRVFHSDLGGIILGLILMIGALVVETLLFTIRLSQVDMKKEKTDKKNLERENKERVQGGFNMTPHAFALPKTKVQSYSLDGKELVSLPASTVSVSSGPSPSPSVTTNAVIELPTQNTKKVTKRNKKGK